VSRARRDLAGRREREVERGPKRNRAVVDPLAEGRVEVTAVSVDAAKPTGLATVKYNFTTPEAEGFEFVKADF
jgi:hypothetical protein